MTSPVSPASTILRPSARSRATLIFTAVPLLLPAVGLGVAAVFLPALTAAAVLVGLLELAAVAYAVLWIVRTRYAYGNGAYLWQSEFLTRRFAPADVEKVVAVDALDFGLQSSPHVFVVGRSTRLLARLNGVTFERVEMEVAVDDLIAHGVAVEQIPGRITLREFDARHPGLLQWIETHRTAFILITVAATLLVMLPVAAITVIGLVA